MTTQKPAARTNLVLALLFAGAFVMGCAEMLVVGMIDLIATDLRVSVPAAGALVTANALGLAVGGPLLTMATTRYDRRTVLLTALVGFVLVNLLPAFGAGYSAFLAARFVIGAMQGLFIAAAFVTATSMVPGERSGRAMAIVISGFASSSAFGMPLGTLLGQAVGWRWSFVVVVLIATVVLAIAVAVIPSVPTPRDSRASGQARFAFAPRVLLVLGIGLLMFAGIQSMLTYLVPFLNQVAGVSGPAVGAFLLAYGVATAVGSFGGGRFADANASKALIVGTAGVTGSLLALYFVGANPLLAAGCVLAVGLFGMGIAPAMQHRVTTLAGPGAPLAASLPASAVNAGIAIGASAGGMTIEAAGVPVVAVTGAAIAAVAVIAAWSARSLKPPVVTSGREPESVR